MTDMQIGELGRRAGVAPKTIRYYEEIGLLAEPNRTPSGYRDYADEAVDRLRFIRDAQTTGLTLTEIASILELRDHGEQTCGHVIDLLEHHLDDIDRQISQLRDTRKLLAKMTERARSLDPSDCADPHRCQTIAPNATAKAQPGLASGRIRGAPSHRHRRARPGP